MKIQRTILDEGVAALTLTGEFDAFATSPFLGQVEAIIQSGITLVVINMRLVLFINSTAVGSLIKARKRLRGLGGDLVFSEMSQRVRETLDMLGLGQLIPSYANEEEAAKALRATAADKVEVPDDNTVFVRANDAATQKKLAGLSGTAKMAAIEENSITFVTTGDAAPFEKGAALKVKFRLPLFRRAYYFDVPCTVKSADKTKDGVKVTAEFGDMVDEDRRSIAQFVRDLRLLREEIRGAGK